MKSYRFTFDPGQKGLRKVLGELEHEIMEVLWGEPSSTVRQVHEVLRKRRKIAYTTVMTVMSRLAEKGLLERHKAGNAFIYTPRVSREDFTRSVIGRIMKGLLRDFTAPALSQFVESVDEMPEEKLDELARLIERRRRRDV